MSFELSVTSTYLELARLSVSTLRIFFKFIYLFLRGRERERGKESMCRGGIERGRERIPSSLPDDVNTEPDAGWA